MFDQREQEAGREHYATAGRALSGLGALGIIVGLVATSRGLNGVGFIDGPSMVVIAAAMGAVGFGMLQAAKRS